jgi:hypothetical protein
MAGENTPPCLLAAHHNIMNGLARRVRYDVLSEVSVCHRSRYCMAGARHVLISTVVRAIGITQD